MFEVHYCSPSEFSSNAYSTGSRRFATAEEFVEWLHNQIPKEKPILITGIVRIR